MEPVTLIKPKKLKSNILVSIPHSGMWFPTSISNQWTQQHLSTLRNTDWHLDILYDFLSDFGVTIVKANYSRYVIDPNRSLKEPLFGPYQKSAVYKTNTWGEEIYLSYPNLSDIEKRIQDYYKPFHQMLYDEIKAINKAYGKAILIDLHSFMGPIKNDVCIGDNHGLSCSKLISDKISEYFSAQGYDAVKNKVFSGGHITQHYGSMPNTEAVQVELRYTTYLPKEELDKPIIPSYECPKFYQVQEKLRNIFSKIINDRLINEGFE